jgi:histidine ammonia-lyase
MQEAMLSVIVDGHHLTIENVVAVAKAEKVSLRLTEQAKDAIRCSASAVQDIVSKSQTAIYGITTGFGAFQKKVISNSDLNQLQINILRSHAAGVGKPLDTQVVRAMMLI